MTRKQLEKLDDRINVLENKREDLIFEMQASCKHPSSEIIEGEYRPGFYLNSDPPFRVCRVCGYAEEGWGCGYLKLRAPNIPKFTRDYAHQYVLKLYSQKELR